MTLLEQLRKDKMQSMREKDKVKTAVISLMMSSISLAEKEGKRALTDEEALKFVQKEAKQTQDALEMTPVSREDLILENKRKLEIITSYLPQQMTKEEIKIALEEIMQEKGLEKNNAARGVLMKEMMSRYAGKTDGKMVNFVVSELLR